MRTDIGLVWPDRIDCAGYSNPRTPPDYSPRDKRAYLFACRNRNCPAERCLEMPEDEPWRSKGTADENVFPVASDDGGGLRALSALPEPYTSKGSV